MIRTGKNYLYVWSCVTAKRKLKHFMFTSQVLIQFKVFQHFVCFIIVQSRVFVYTKMVQILLIAAGF
jgi:hypothetical protein